VKRWTKTAKVATLKLKNIPLYEEANI